MVMVKMEKECGGDGLGRLGGLRGGKAGAERLEARRRKASARKAARRKGRSARFSVQVVSRYKFKYALTGMCCPIPDGAAIVDTAYIESWAESENDDIKNGLALCKNAHWMFDEGLWSVLSDGRVVLAPFSLGAT